MPDDWGMYYTTCDHCGTRYHQSEGGCDCQADCKAHRPWIHGVWLRDGGLQLPCRTCEMFGGCQWSGPEDATDWGEYLDKQQEEMSDDDIPNHVD